MKRFVVIIVLIVLVASIFVVLLTSGQRKGGAQREVLHDFRRETRARTPRITAATTKKVLSTVFRSYLTDEKQCKNEFDTSGSDDYLENARRAGMIVPEVIDMATGAFTAPGERQTAYVIDVSECGASHADNNGSKRIAIFSGDKLVADVDASFKRTILRVTDLDSDGASELLMTGGDMNQGIVIEVASLISLRDGQLRVLQDFEKVTENSCESGLPDSNQMAAVITYAAGSAKGQMPELLVENYKASCKNTRWRFLSKGKMPD
jgi:hypothetical protein